MCWLVLLVKYAGRSCFGVERVDAIDRSVDQMMMMMMEDEGWKRRCGTTDGGFDSKHATTKGQVRLVS